MTSYMDIKDYLLLHTTGNFYWKDTNGRYLGCNLEFARIAGFSHPDGIVGNTDRELFLLSLGEESVRKIENTDQDVIKNNKSVVVEELGVDQYGKEAYYLSKKIPLKDSNGVIIGVMGTSIDITEKRNMEEIVEKTQQQLKGMTLVTASIAHELRTPLAAIKSAAAGINKTLPDLIASYKIASEQSLNLPKVSKAKLELINAILPSIVSKVDQSNLVIDMLLANIRRPSEKLEEFEICSARESINKALAQYIFPTKNAPKIIWNQSMDFTFLGNETLLIHVLFNLIKNSIYFIQKAGKGDIEIWIEKKTDFNSIHFKDTGLGVEEEYLNSIFDQFFTKDTDNGTGIGLAYCKYVMELFKGEIFCLSEVNKYTEFVLKFPVIAHD